MPFVPGLRHDLFLSYAHTDDPSWVKAFETTLRVGLRDRLGHDVSIWQDTHELRLGQNWQAEIEAAIDQTAAFVALVSPGYMSSTWCMRERRHFLEAEAGTNRAARAERFLKVIKTPTENRAEERLLPHIQDIRFVDRQGEQAVGFAPGTEEFRLGMTRMVDAVARLLRAMRRRHERVFVGTPAADGLGDWEGLRNELQAQGFDVRPDGPIDSSFADDFVTEELHPAVLAAFIVTGRHEPFLAHQLALARGLSKRMLVWLHPNVASADAKQRTFIDAVRGGTVLSPEASLLEGMSSRDMIQHVLDALKPRPVADALPRNGHGPSRMYLLYDPTTEGDAQVAVRVRDAVRAQPIDVFVPDATTVQWGSRSERHQQLLRECDGVLVCRSRTKAPDQWLLQTVPDVLFAEQQLQRPAMRSKAFLVAEPDTLRGLPNVIPLIDPNRIPSLDAFLSPLLEGRP
jgi:TIR domain